MRYRRAWCRFLAVLLLTVGLVMMARGAPQIAIIVQLILALVCAIVSLRIRDY